MFKNLVSRYLKNFKILQLRKKNTERNSLKC